MIAHSIEHGLASRLINRVIVSTDDQEISAVAREYGAEVPFQRPAEFAQDHSLDIDVFHHALDWLHQNEGYQPDLIVHLRPTCPVRRIQDIDAAIQILLDQPDFDSVRSVVRSPATPYKMWFMDDDHLLKPVMVAAGLHEPYNLARQLLPQTYLQAASIDVVRTRVITTMNSMTGLNIYGYLLDEFFDIDTIDDLLRVSARLDRASVVAPTGAANK